MQFSCGAESLLYWAVDLPWFHNKLIFQSTFLTKLIFLIELNMKTTFRYVKLGIDMVAFIMDLCQLMLVSSNSIEKSAIPQSIWCTLLVWFGHSTHFCLPMNCFVVNLHFGLEKSKRQNKRLVFCGNSATPLPRFTCYSLLSFSDGSHLIMPPIFSSRLCFFFALRHIFILHYTERKQSGDIFVLLFGFCI